MLKYQFLRDKHQVCFTHISYDGNSEPEFSTECKRKRIKYEVTKMAFPFLIELDNQLHNDV